MRKINIKQSFLKFLYFLNSNHTKFSLVCFPLHNSKSLDYRSMVYVTGTSQTIPLGSSKLLGRSEI